MHPNDLKNSLEEWVTYDLEPKLELKIDEPVDAPEPQSAILMDDGQTVRFWPNLVSGAIATSDVGDLSAANKSILTTDQKSPATQSLNLREAIDGIDDLIIKLKDKKKSISLSQEGYKEIVSIYSEVIRDLIEYKDSLYNSNMEDN